MMIKLTTDEEVHEADMDLVRDYAEALVDRDKQMMIEVLYLTHQRMERTCRCFEVNCTCDLK